MDDWGKVSLNKIIDGNEFWFLIDELQNDDDYYFINNRKIVVDAYKNGNLYSLRVTETTSMYNRNAREDNIFCKNSWYLLPCFCIKEDNKAITIWTHSRARRNGFAKKLLNLLHIEYSYNPYPNSIQFWEACNIKTIFKNAKKN